MDVRHVSSKEYIILDLLRSGAELYGLEMVKLSDGTLKRGTIYVTLGRMVEKGYLTSRQEKTPDDPGLPRRFFVITGDGRLALQAADNVRAIMQGSVGGWQNA